ncbi:hypothetical protein ACOMHN_052541 [Nucella lapillus]
MVRNENCTPLRSEAPVLTCKLVKEILRNKFVVILGDSIQRGIYKDLVSLLQRDRILTERDLKAKGEMAFMFDNLIEGGVKEGLNNGTSYTEVRQYHTTTHLIRFYFITRCYNAYVESILLDLQEGPKPDLVIMNSCLWDITRYGTSAIDRYKENLSFLFFRFMEVLPPECLVVWNTTMPISKNARGGFLVKEVECDNSILRIDVLEANFYARQIVVSCGFDVLDLHFWFRHHIDWRVADGIHWNPLAHRHMSELLLSHVANAWGFPIPPFQFCLKTHPLRRRPVNIITPLLKEVASHLNGEPPCRLNIRGRSASVPHRPAPYPLLPGPTPPRLSRYEENGHCHPPPRPPRIEQENGNCQRPPRFEQENGPCHPPQRPPRFEQENGPCQRPPRLEQGNGNCQRPPRYEQENDHPHTPMRFPRFKPVHGPPGTPPQQLGYEQDDGHPDWSPAENCEPFQNHNHFPGQHGDKFCMPNGTETESFRNGWSPYFGDSLRGAERRPGRGSRYRNSYY